MASVKLTVSVNGGTAVTGFESGGFGGFGVGATDTIQLGATDTTGWRSQKWRIRDYPPGFTPGGTWTTDADGSFINTSLVPSLITLPGGGMFGVFTPGVEVVFDDNTTAQDYSTAFEVSHFDGYHGVAAGEGTHFGGPRRAWAKNLDATIRALVSNIGGGGGGGGAIDPFSNTDIDPTALVGHASQFLRVKSDETRLESVAGSLGPTFGNSDIVHAMRFSGEEYNDVTSVHGNTYNNYDWHGASVVYVPDAYYGIVTITGLLAPSDGKACTVHFVTPKGGYGITFMNESGSSTNVNRIQTGSSGSNNVKWIATYCPHLTDIAGGGTGTGRWAVMAYPIT